MGGFFVELSEGLGGVGGWVREEGDEFRLGKVV